MRRGGLMVASKDKETLTYHHGRGQIGIDFHGKIRENKNA